jgi:hypothetical protein
MKFNATKNCAFQVLGRTLLVVLTLGLGACGGGGGGAPEAPPRLQAITHQGTPAIRDNVTGIIWAGKLGAEDLPARGVDLPTAAELLTLADSGEQVLQTQLGFLLNTPYPVVKASDLVIGSSATVAWAVDFGARGEPGGLSDENPNDALSWYVLSRPAASAPVFYSVNARFGMVETDNLMWKLCSQGAEWTGSSCTGTPTRVTGTEALATSSWGSYAGYNSGWRLPTKKELQGLLQLSNNLSPGGSLLPAAFIGDAVGSDLAQYWSSTRASGASPQRAWQVDFSVLPDPGGVERALLTDTAYIRLVRSR